jgi:hypothetical protein
VHRSDAFCKIFVARATINAVRYLSQMFFDLLQRRQQLPKILNHWFPSFGV